jgi:hypothetical protein
MRAIVLDHPGTFRVAEVPDPVGEAVNRVRSGQGIKWHIRP